MLTQIAIATSELVSIFLIWRLWKSEDFLFFKLMLSFFALIPFLGPVLVLWLSNFPDPQPIALRDQRRQTDVLDRWRGVFEENNPLEKFRKWKQTMGVREDDGPYK